MKAKTNSIWGPVLVICLTIVVSSAVTATAAKLITGKQIKNSSITGVDVKNSSLTGVDVKNSSLTGVDVKNSSLTGSDIRNGTIGKADLAPGVAISGPAGAAGAAGAAGPNGTARAYAAVDPSPLGLVPGQVKNFLAVSSISTGIYCLQLDPSIDRDSAVPVAAFDWWNSSVDNAFVDVYSNSGSCAADEIRIRTYAQDGATLIATAAFHVIIP